MRLYDYVDDNLVKVETRDDCNVKGVISGFQKICKYYAAVRIIYINIHNALFVQDTYLKNLLDWYPW